MTIDEQKYRNALLNSHLRTLKDAKNLQDINYARLISIILYLGDELSEEEISHVLEKEVLKQRIPSASLAEGLALLKLNNVAKNRAGKWKLTEDITAELNKNIKETESKEARVLQKFFPRSIDQAKLRNWFLDTSSEYFSSQSERLVKMFIKKEPRELGVEELVKKTVKKHSLEKFSEDLLQGYKEFLSSDDSEVEDIIWNFMQSLLSTKLLVADISPDQISIDRYKGAKVVVDTNILLAIKLKSKKSINKSIKALSEAMQALDMELYVTEWTKQEYSNVCTAEKNNTKKIFNEYDLEIIQNTKGDFLRAALRSECENEEDIESLFKEISKLPAEFGELSIKEIDENDTSAIKIQNTRSDIALRGSIEEASKKNYVFKVKNALIHDTLLTKFVDSKRGEGESNYFVLTLDRSMEELALTWVNEKEDPTWINFVTLIQMLAINGTGSQFDSSNLAPLVKAFIEYQGYGKFQQFKKADLIFLTNCTDRIKELPNTKVVNILQKIHRKDITGISKKEKNALELEIQREITISKADISRAITEKDSALKAKDATIKDLKDENLELKQKHFKNKQIFWLIIKILIYLAGSYLLFIILGDRLLQEWNAGNEWEYIQMLLVILTPAGGIWHSIHDFRNKIKSYNK